MELDIHNEMVINRWQIEEDKLKQIQDQYKITIRKNEKAPYHQIIENKCREDKYFYKYKRTRVHVLKDEEV